MVAVAGVHAENLAQHLALHTIVHEGPLVAGSILKLSDFPLTMERFMMYLVVVRGDVHESRIAVRDSLEDLFNGIEEETKEGPLAIGIDMDGTRDKAEMKDVVEILKDVLESRPTRTEIALIHSPPSQEDENNWRLMFE
jgi:hypothetical protein